MTQIRIDTEHTREVARQLITESDRLSEIGHELQNAIGGLDTWAWDGRSRSRAEPLLSRVRPESSRAAEGLDVLGRKLVRVADTFEQEDDTAARNLEGMGWVDFEDDSGIIDLTGAYLDSASYFAEGINDWQERAEVLASILVACSMVKGDTYPGQAIFYGGRHLKEIAGLSPYLTHVKDAQIIIPSHMTKQAFKSQFSKGNFLLEGLTEVGENWEEYKGDVPKVATGIVMDTLIGVGCSAIGVAAGTFVLGAVGGVLLGPPGAVIGGKIGGVLGGMAGGWVAEKVEDIKIGDRELDQVVVETVTGEIQASAQAVDQALSPFVNSVARLF